MHWFDVGVSIALLLGGVWSFFRGLMREIMSILGIIAAFALSTEGYAYAAEQLEAFIALAWLRQVIGFGLIFVATMVLYVAFTLLLHRLVKAAGLSIPNRLLGGLFGLIKVGVVVTVLLLITAQFFPPFASRLADESLLAPTFFHTAHALSTLVPQRASDEFRQVYRHVRRQLPMWMPAPAPLRSGPPTAAPSRTSPQSPNGISESDARALEKILRERLKEP